jgi:hypothetical protein
MGTDETLGVIAPDGSPVELYRLMRPSDEPELIHNAYRPATYTNLHNHLPDLTSAIAARHRSYLEAQGARRRQCLRDEVRRVAIQLHLQGFYPSANRIAPRLSRPGAMRGKTAQSAWREALRELGWNA